MGYIVILAAEIRGKKYREKVCEKIQPRKTPESLAEFAVYQCRHMQTRERTLQNYCFLLVSYTYGGDFRYRHKPQSPFSR